MFFLIGFDNSIITWREVRRYLHDFWWFEVEIMWHEGPKDEMQARNKKKSIGSNDIFWYIGYNLSYETWIEMILKLF